MDDAGPGPSRARQPTGATIGAVEYTADALAPTDPEDNAIADAPLVSVVIPVYDAETTLAATLDSVLSQDGVDLDVVVVDDGSTDGTPDVLAAYADRVRVVRIENSGGPSRPRNVGFENARAERVAVFDSDDLMEPGKLARQMRALDAHPDAGFVCSDFRVIDETGRLLVERFLDTYQVFRRLAAPTDDPRVLRLPAEKAWSHLLDTNFVGTSSVLTHRDLVRELGGFNEAYRNADDIDMWLRIARSGRDVVFVDEVLHAYRKVQGGVTARGGLRNEAMIRVLEENRPYATDAADLAVIRRRLAGLWSGFGWTLRRRGRRDEAQDAYRAALREGAGMEARVGLLRSRLGI